MCLGGQLTGPPDSMGPYMCHIPRLTERLFDLPRLKLTHLLGVGPGPLPFVVDANPRATKVSDCILATTWLRTLRIVNNADLCATKAADSVSSWMLVNFLLLLLVDDAEPRAAQVSHCVLAGTKPRMLLAFPHLTVVC